MASFWSSRPDRDMAEPYSGLKYITLSIDPLKKFLSSHKLLDVK